MNKQMKTCLLLILAGIVAMVAGIFIKNSLDSQVARDTEAATATVVAYEEGEQYDSTMETYETVYYPIVTYEVAGETVESKYGQFEYDTVYEIGGTVEIKYNPDDPEEFYIVGDDNMDTSFMWTIPVGAIMIIIGLVGFLAPIIAAKKN